MSLFASTDVSVAPAVPLMSAGPLLSEADRRNISAGLAATGTAAAGAGVAAAAVGTAAAAALVLGVGWGLYAGGKLAYEGMKRTKRETEEKEEFARILEEQRCNMAKEERRQILDKCHELKETWSSSLEAADAELKSRQAVQELYAEIQNVEQFILKGTADEMENDNLRDWEYLNQAAERMEVLIKEHFENLKQKEDRQRIVSLLEKLHKIMQVISLNKNASGHDVKGRSVEEERLRKCKKRTEALTANLKYAVEREKLREYHMPVEKEDRAYLHHLLDGADKVISTLVSGQISLEQKEYLLEDFEKRLAQYQVKKVQLNEKEERFVCLYDVYCEVICKMGEKPKSPTDFASLQELEEVMETMKKRVERLEICAQIYGKIGKEAYICMAFDTEMENLGYKMAERKQAQQFVTNQLKNAKVDDTVIPYYSMPDRTLTQFYHFGESTCVQVIVREDGTTSLETFAATGNVNRETVIREQNEHCRLNAELDKALREKWFISSNLTEVIPPDVINVKNPKTMENPTYTSGTEGWDEIGTQGVQTQYLKFDS